MDGKSYETYHWFDELFKVIKMDEQVWYVDESGTKPVPFQNIEKLTPFGGAEIAEVTSYLKHLVAFDCVDDESKAEPRLSHYPSPTEWSEPSNPPYSYWLYYLWANLKELNEFRKRNYGTKVVNHLIHEAKKLNIKRLSLETGAGSFFSPARNLFIKCGFKPCKPFAHYKEDINSIYMSLLLSNY